VSCRRAWTFAVAAGLCAPGAATAAATGTATSGAPLSDPALALAALDRRIADIDAEEQSDKLELARLGERLASLHAKTLVHGRAFYKLTRAGLLPLGGGFGALVSYAMHVERARRLVIADVLEESQARERTAALVGELERVARDRTALASQRTAMDAARLAVQDEQRRQAAFDRAFESPGPGGFVPVYGASGLDPAGPAGFASARGRLVFPVAGRADVRPAHREGAEGPGLELHAGIGAAVRAVFAGRVAFADRYGPYGRIVILDHGDHYYTVSGDLASIDVKIGQEVGAGERIGTVGDDGQGPMLYFEVRHGSQAVAPAAWLGI
jgi:murein DD-endopeptidase MepM/ murein hydrolase activator NlpD